MGSPNDESDYKLECLRLACVGAHNFEGPSEVIVARATMYYAFLRGPTATVKPARKPNRK